jgi:hypothetical protein
MRRCTTPPMSLDLIVIGRPRVVFPDTSSQESASIRQWQALGPAVWGRVVSIPQYDGEVPVAPA